LLIFFWKITKGAGAGAKCDHLKLEVRTRVRAYLNLDVRGACVRPQKRSQLTRWTKVSLVFLMLYSLVPKIQICPATLITLEIVARCRYYPTTLKPSTTLPRSHTANQIIVTLPHFARKSFWNLSLDVAEMGKNIFGLLYF